MRIDTRSLTNMSGTVISSRHRVIELDGLTHLFVPANDKADVWFDVEFSDGGGHGISSRHRKKLKATGIAEICSRLVTRASLDVLPTAHSSKSGATSCMQCIEADIKVI